MEKTLNNVHSSLFKLSHFTVLDFNNVFYQQNEAVSYTAQPR